MGMKVVEQENACLSNAPMHPSDTIRVWETIEQRLVWQKAVVGQGWE
jgi:hypothetical protein